MPQDPKQGIAGTCERIDGDILVPRHMFGNRSNIETNTIAEGVTGALHRSAAKNTDTATMPFVWPHSEHADVVGVRETIEAVLLNFGESQYFIAFCAMQQKCPIINM